MQKTFKRFNVIAVFAALLVIPTGNGVLTLRQLKRQIATETRLAQSRRLILELEQTESLLKDAETGQRGYLYTGDSRYLAPYDLAVRDLDSHFNRLMQMTAGTPQQESIVNLHALEQVKMGELAQTIALYRAGDPEEARGLVLSNLGLLTMEHFRGIIDALEHQERSQEAEHNTQYEKTVSATIASIYFAGGLATVGLVFLAYFILREMSLREQHAHQIREREEWFRTTLTSIGDAVIATDPSGKVSFLNPVAEALTGMDLRSAQGRDIADVFPIFNEVTGEPADNPVRRVMSEGQVVGLANHTVLRHAEGRLIPIEDSAAPIRDDSGSLAGVVLVFRDVTSERKAQELVRRSEKLAAAARLSATVAHEINNPLEAVSNLVYLAKAHAGASAEVVQHLTLAERELERVAHITRQTLGFYRESNEPGQVDIPAIVDSVLRLYSNKIDSKRIRIECRLDDCPAIHAIAGELKQALSNLLSNAIDAVSQGGTIHITAKPPTENNQLTLVIEDDGPGVPADMAERIFEPFFTTKKDVGTGLGLWVTREIVERHGGTIRLAAHGRNSSRGAAFIVSLPRRLQPRSSQAAPADRPASQSPAPHRQAEGNPAYS